MIVCWLVVNTLFGVGMQVVAEAVPLGSTLDLLRDLLFDTLAKTDLTRFCCTSRREREFTRRTAGYANQEV